MNHRGLLLLVCLCVSGSVANAQPRPSPSAAPASPDFLTHYNFQLSAAALSNEDPRFSWDTHFGADIDLVDYVVGRFNFVGDYQALCGSEFRPWDPYQGNYILEGSLSVRTSAAEIAGVFHHVSRHLGDRPKRFAIAWNVLGVRALRRFDFAGTIVDAQGGAGRVVQHSSVDYAWTADLDLVIRRPLTSRIGVFAHGFGELYGVSGAIRGRQQDGRVEGGVRLSGRAAAVELFAGVERRIDADPLHIDAFRWAFVGFRFVGK